MRAVHVLMKALPQLGLNLDDAARSEADYEAAEQVGGWAAWRMGGDVGVEGEGERWQIITCPRSESRVSGFGFWGLGFGVWALGV